MSAPWHHLLGYCTDLRAFKRVRSSQRALSCPGLKENRHRITHQARDIDACFLATPRVAIHEHPHAVAVTNLLSALYVA